MSKKLDGMKRRLEAACRALKGDYFRTSDGIPHAVLNQPGAKNAPASATRANAQTDKVFIQETICLDDTKKTVEALNPSYCCGCGACYNSCPVDAITMTSDEQGFFTPVIDQEKCINCGKCKKACPVLNTKYVNTKNPDCYAVMADDEIRKDSSSGGMFSLVANYVLEQGGYVCGAALTDDFSVEHMLIHDKAELPKLRRSKYVQSNTKDCYSQIKKLLTDGEQVLFAGCPCQVAGLYGFLGKDFENLITLDLVCHGGPSQKVFKKYLDDTYGRENMKGFVFRTKEFGYNSFNQTAYLKDGRQISGNVRFDPYERTMHSGLALKTICADCPFAEAPRQGTLSIGDFWGVTKYNPKYNDNIGTSCVLVNNEKGKAFFEKIRSNMKMVEPIPFDFARKHNRFGRRMRIPVKGRTWLYNCLDAQPFNKNVDYALNRKFDVGVIGLWYGRNYGSMATYYALHQVLKKKMHLSVAIIQNPLKPKNANPVMEKSHPGRIAEEFYDVTAQYSLADMKQLNEQCDAFIVGSDQLWNVGLSRPYKQTYYLEFVRDDKKKIAYGTSFAKPYGGTKEELLISSRNLRRFDHVSVRDTLSKEISEKQFGVKNVAEVCDPTFLCPLEEYQVLIDKAQVKEDAPYILAYILDPNAEVGKELEQLSIQKNKKVIVLLNESPKVWQENLEKLALSGNGNVEVKKEVDLYEWLWYYSHAESVVTDSFHGTIFSIIFEKPFLTMSNAKRGATRFVSLLTPIGLMDRLFEGSKAIGENQQILDELDYTEVNKALDAIREESYAWLHHAIFSKKVEADTDVRPVWER